MWQALVNRRILRYLHVMCTALITVILLPEIYSTVSQKGLKDDTGGFNLPSVVDSMDIGNTETKEKRRCCVVMWSNTSYFTKPTSPPSPSSSSSSSSLHFNIIYFHHINMIWSYFYTVSDIHVVLKFWMKHSCRFVIS